MLFGFYALMPTAYIPDRIWKIKIAILRTCF
jgi:hypothetical protein